MKQLLIGIALLAVTAAILLVTDFASLLSDIDRTSDIESKGAASEITEWVKLAIAVVTLLIGIVNLRLALGKKDAGP